MPKLQVPLWMQMLEGGGGQRQKSHHATSPGAAPTAQPAEPSGSAVWEGLQAQVRPRAAVTFGLNTSSGNTQPPGAALRPSPFTPQMGTGRSGEGELCPSHLCSLSLCLARPSSPRLVRRPCSGCTCLLGCGLQASTLFPRGTGSSLGAGLQTACWAAGAARSSVASSACPGEHCLGPSQPLLPWRGHGLEA